MNLLFISPNRVGGTVTYTAHLAHALYSLGIEAPIYRLASRDEMAPRPFGYGLTYRNVGFETMADLTEERTLIVHAHSDHVDVVEQLMDLGAWFTIHDPGDVKVFEGLADRERVVVIRKANLAACPNATYIPHPYVRTFNTFQAGYQGRPHHATTLSRLASNKKTSWVLEANRLLPPQKQIQLRGSESRMYTWGLSKKYPEFHQDPARGWAAEMGAAERIARDARFMVDLTDMPGDGGGSQYTYLHAVDAGAAVVLNSSWVTPEGVWRPGWNCLAVDSPTALADALSAAGPTLAGRLARNAYDLLAEHDPAAVARLYKRVIS